MKKLILEDNTPTNTDKYPIKIKVIAGKTYEFGLSGSLMVYREKGATNWQKDGIDDELYTQIRQELYNLGKNQGIYDTPENTYNSSDKKVKTKGKCLPLKTPPAGLTLNITNPGDKNYVYGKVGEEWFAQNIKNKKIFNLTKCNYTSSIAKLEKLKPSSANDSVEQLQSQSNEIQKSVGLPETGSFDIKSLEKLITFLSDEERPKVQSVNSLGSIKGVTTPSPEEQLKQIASQQTIRQ